MKRRAADLEARLVEWGREYGGGRHEDIGWSGKSWLDTMIKYHGRAPDGLSVRGSSNHRTPADRVEDAVRLMEAGEGGHRLGGVLRCEYFSTSDAGDTKLQNLRKVGHSMTREGFNDALEQAKRRVGEMLRGEP